MNEAVRNPAQPIIEIENLSISFFTRKGEIPAVMDFSCTVMPGEAMGIVGESGCGKSTVSLGIMRDLSNIGKIVGGRIKFQGRDMGEMSDEELAELMEREKAIAANTPNGSPAGQEQKVEAEHAAGHAAVELERRGKGDASSITNGARAATQDVRR